MDRTLTAADVMNPHILTVSADITTDELSRYLIDREISGAPVVDDKGHIIGVVSMTDIARSLADNPELDTGDTPHFYRDASDDLTLEDLGQRYIEERALTVRDVMTPVIHQVPVTATIKDIAGVMLAEHIHRVVVTQGKQPVGIVTSMDVLKSITEAT